MSGVWVYILECNDKSLYVGSCQGKEPEARLWEHNNRTYPNAYTAKRLPVRLVHAAYYESIVEGLAAERQVKGWSRAKKLALIAENWSELQNLAKRRGGR
ncbi:MAG: GIY-YIG nuclease family protein [Aestuariivirga sp.]